MELTPVQSAAMTHVGHDGKDLHVVYASGKHYVHPDVPVAKFAGLMAAESKGHYLNAHIAKQHPGSHKGGAIKAARS